MKFTKMILENFLTITQAEVNFADRGLVAIQGINSDDTSADSNGAGKSSIGDGLSWILYGTTARGVSGDDVINNTVGKNTLGKVGINDNGDVYTVTRHRKHAKGKNSVAVHQLKTDGTTADLTKGTDKLTQEVINRILGSSYEVFTGAIYAGQEKMPDLPSMTDKQLKVLIEEASGVALLEEAYKEANKRLAAKKAVIDTINQSIATSDARKSWLQSQIDTDVINQGSWEIKRTEGIQAGKDEIKTLVTKAKSLEVDIANYDFPTLIAKIADCDKRIASVSAESAQLQKLTQEAAQQQNALNNCDATISNANRLLTRFMSELSAIDHKVGCPCSECGRPLTENELEAAKKAAQERVDDAQKQIDAANKDKIEFTRLFGLKAKEVQDFRATMTDTSAVSVERQALSGELARGEAVKADRTDHVKRAKSLGERLKEIAGETNPFDAVIKKHNKDMLTAREADKEILEKLEKANVELAEAEAVSKVFSPAGVRAFILDEVTPFLNQQTAKYLATLSDGNITANWTTLVKNAKGELREKFSIEVEKKDRAKSFAGLSGGEKRKVRIAAALALQDLVATRASKPIDLFIGDEIDDALDPAGLERLMQILEDKAKERGSVIVISHNSLRDWISSVIQVETKNNKTVVTETN